MAKEDDHLRAVYDHHQELKAAQKYTIIEESERILRERNVQMETTEQGDHQMIGAKLRKTQMDDMQLNMAQKTTHRKYWLQTQRDERNTELCHLWLNNGRFTAETEAFIIAMQDGLLYTRERRANVLKEDCSKVCRLCKAEFDTTDHILTRCSIITWTWYKERHD